VTPSREETGSIDNQPLPLLLDNDLPPLHVYPKEEEEGECCDIDTDQNNIPSRRLTQFLTSYPVSLLLNWISALAKSKMYHSSSDPKLTLCAQCAHN